MKNMNMKLLGFVILQAFIYMSCGQNNNNTSPGRCDNRNAAGCAGNVAAQGNTDIALQGLFYGSDQDLFQQSVVGLASADVTANAIGTVSDGQINDGTGIAFGAKVSMNAGKATTATAGSAIAPASRLLVGIYDSFVGQQAPSGQVIGPIEIPMSTATGTAGGGSADVTFNDKFGTIRFVGTYDGTNFKGTVQYNTTSVVTGATASSGQFKFEIPTCSFFVCN